jgi:hypothetical protein
VTLICRIDLNKKEGMALHVTDEQTGATQAVVLDGSSLTLTVSGKDENTKTTIFQNDQDIKISCKTFILEAETINCSSQQDSNYESAQALKIKSQGALDVTSQSDLSQSAVGNVKLCTGSGQLNLETSGVATLKGAITQVQGKVSLG